MLVVALIKNSKGRIVSYETIDPRTQTRRLHLGAPPTKNSPAPAPAPRPEPLMAFSPPDTLGRVVALRAHPVKVSEYVPAAVDATPLRVKREPLIYADDPHTLARVVQRQRMAGLRPVDPVGELRTMARGACERCGKASCDCPPPAPRTLDAVVQIQAARLKAQEAARPDYWPPLK